MVVAEIATGYGALKSAYEIAKGLKDINDRVALNAAVIDLQEKILSAQEAASEAKQKLRELQEIINDFDDWAATATRYRLKDYGCQSYAYEAKQESLGGDPPHIACPNCFRERRLSILQFDDTYWGRKKFKCLACAKEVDLGCSTPAQGSRSSGGDYDPLRDWR
ncbi:MAG: hypothetical protein E5X76_20240 [Mesorhizobium sp.]|nr:MAG: hypothetical protein E5X76_20240 [Mesorhizobium sp.]